MVPAFKFSRRIEIFKDQLSTFRNTVISANIKDRKDTVLLPITEIFLNLVRQLLIYYDETSTYESLFVSKLNCALPNIHVIVDSWFNRHSDPETIYIYIYGSYIYIKFNIYFNCCPWWRLSQTAANLFDPPGYLRINPTSIYNICDGNRLFKSGQ